MRRREHSLQIAVAHMLQIVLDPEKTWWSSIDHGVGKLGVAEAGIRKKRGVKAGLPDIILMWPGSRRDEVKVIGLELKVGKAQLSRAQDEVSEAWLAMGATMYVPHSLEEVQEILEANDVPMRTRMTLFPKVSYGPIKRASPTRHSHPRHARQSKDDVSVVLKHPTKEK